MYIELKKFGTILTSRQDGREALSAIKSKLQMVEDSEKIEIDFAGVSIFTPSWSDEFITKLKEKFGNKVTLLNTDNPSVKATLDLLDSLD